jgi:hypothetical protein
LPHHAFERHLTHARRRQCLVQRWAVRTLAVLDFRELGNDAPVAPVQVRRDGLTLCFDARTLLGARGTN